MTALRHGFTDARNSDIFTELNFFLANFRASLDSPPPRFPRSSPRFSTDWPNDCVTRADTTTKTRSGASFDSQRQASTARVSARGRTRAEVFRTQYQAH